MNTKIKTIVLAAVTAAAILGLALVSNSQQLAIAGGNNGSKEKEIDLAESKLIIEHNAADKDTGFQGFIDSEEGWKRITVTDPDGNKVLDFRPQGDLGRLGLTELFFETTEPENADVSINELLKTMPEGEYTFRGFTADSAEEQGTLIGTADLSHDIPEAPAIITPEEDEEIPEDEDLLVSWEPVDKNIDGSGATIIAYQLIIEKDVEDPEPHMIGTFGLSMYLPDDVTEITVPADFLEPNTDYVMEVLAISENGNQSINSTSFSTSG